MNWTALRERLLGENPNDVRPPKLAIPALPEVALEFCRATDRPDATIVELAGILERDGGLVVDLLRNVNSSSTGVRTKVNSARTAIGLLGPRRTKMFVLTSGMQTTASKVKSPFATPARFSFAAMQRAVFARRLAERLSLDGDLAFAGALLQDFAVPALTAERPDRYAILLENLTDAVPSIATLEQARFGWDHAMAGARLMLSWQFPDDLVCLVLTQHWVDPILNSPTFSGCELVAVALSTLLPDPFHIHPSRTALLEHHLSTRFGIDVAPFREWVNEDVLNAGVAVDPSLAWAPKSGTGVSGSAEHCAPACC